MANILVVYDKDTPGGTVGDQALAGHLTDAGHTVTMLMENDSGHPYLTYDVVVITESGSASSVDAYDTAAVPLVSLEYTWSRIRMGGAGSSGATQNVDLVGTHTLNTGFSDPMTMFTGNASTWTTTTSTLPSGVEVLAVIAGDSTRPIVAVAESGATLTSGTAPARRVCFSVSDSSGDMLTAEGQAYFVAVTEWAAGIGGSVPAQGSATGTFSWVGTAAGTAPANNGSATGTHTWTGSATGARASAGTATGTHTWVGTGVGNAPANNGSASGTFSFTGSASGARTPKASASGTHAWTGTASGARTPKGSCTGTHVWTGTGSGARAARGSCTGTFSFAGSAHGARASRGSTSGAHAWTGAASGARASQGTASGTFRWVGIAGFITGIDVSVAVGVSRHSTTVADSRRAWSVADNRRAWSVGDSRHAWSVAASQNERGI